MQRLFCARVFSEKNGSERLFPNQPASRNDNKPMSRQVPFVWKQYGKNRPLKPNKYADGKKWHEWIAFLMVLLRIER